MTDPRVEILDRTVAFDGFFQLVRYRLRHGLFAGGMGPVAGARAVRARPCGGRAALRPGARPGRAGRAVPDRRARAAGEPWLLEPVAGIVEPGESAAEVAAREAHEEAGLELRTSCRSAPTSRARAARRGCTCFVGRVEAAAPAGCSACRRGRGHQGPRGAARGGARLARGRPAARREHADHAAVAALHQDCAAGALGPARPPAPALESGPAAG